MLGATGLVGCPDADTPLDTGRPVVATVDNEPLYLDDFLRSFHARGPGTELQGVTDPVTLRELKLRFLEEEIERRLLLAEAEQRKIEVDAATVDAAVAAIRADYPGERFREMLAARNLTPDDLRASLAGKLRLDALLAQVLAVEVAPITESEVEAYYKLHPQEFAVPARVRMRQIVVPTREEARRVRDEILGGLDFAEAARRYSATPDGAHGGDLGYFERSVMPPVFDEYGFSAKPNQVSSVVESEYGYHLFLVLDRSEPTTLPQDEVRDRIRRRLTTERLDRGRADYLARLVSDHQILRHPEILEAVAAAPGGAP